MATSNPRYDEQTPIAVQLLEKSLMSILDEHYCIQGQLFPDLTAHHIAKHEVCHLTKVLQKIQFYFDDTSKQAIERIQNEVVPDLIIFALEFAVKFDIQWWKTFSLSSIPQGIGVLNYMKDKYPIAFDTEIELLNLIRKTLILAVSKLGHFCDLCDHDSNPNVNIENEVIIPFLLSSLYLSGFYQLDLEHLFSTRLLFVRNKYVGQPNFSPEPNYNIL